MRLCGVEESNLFPVMKRIFQCALEFDPHLSPPEMAMHIHRIIRAECGKEDPYLEMKKQSIAEVSRQEKHIRERIGASENPFRTAVRFALVGNVLDFAIFDWNPEQLNEQLEAALHKPLDEAAMTRLENAAKSAKKVLFLGDNAGESVFDKLLIEQLHGKEVVYAVRGGPAINDVTLSDAIASGLDKVAVLRSSGLDAPGTLLDQVSEEFRKDFDSADLVIAKGQGNYESLNECGRKIFFLTQIKCPVVAHDLKGRVGDWVIAESSGGSRMNSLPGSPGEGGKSDE